MNWLKRLRRPTHQVGNASCVAVVGALRTGTNFVRHIIEAHWPVTVTYNAYGWKHAGIPVLGPGSDLSYPAIPIIFVVKNPYAFVVSLYRYRMLAETKGHRISLDGAVTFDAFLRGPVTLRDSQLRESPELRFGSPLQYWNFIYWNLERLDPQRFPAVGLNYETIVETPDCLAAVDRLIPVPRNPGMIVLPETTLRRTSDRKRKGKEDVAQAFDTAYYTQRRYLEEFTAGQLDFVRREADPWLMERRGYRFE